MLLVAALLLGAASAGLPATPQEWGEKSKVLDDVLMLKRARSPDDDPYDKETLREGKASPPDCLAFLFQGAGAGSANGIYWKTHGPSRIMPSALYARPYAKGGRGDAVAGAASAAGKRVPSLMVIRKCPRDGYWSVQDATFAGCPIGLPKPNNPGELYKLTVSNEDDGPFLDGLEGDLWTPVVAAGVRGQAARGSPPTVTCVQRAVPAREVEKLVAQVALAKGGALSALQRAGMRGAEDNAKWKAKLALFREGRFVVRHRTNMAQLIKDRVTSKMKVRFLVYVWPYSHVRTTQTWSQPAHPLLPRPLYTSRTTPRQVPPYRSPARSPARSPVYSPLYYPVYSLAKHDVWVPPHARENMRSLKRVHRFCSLERIHSLASSTTLCPLCRLTSSPSHPTRFAPLGSPYSTRFTLLHSLHLLRSRCAQWWEDKENHMLAEVRRATEADSDAVANIVREEIHAEEEAALEHARGAIRREVEALIGAFKSNMEATVTKGGLDLKTSLHRTVEQRVGQTQHDIHAALRRVAEGAFGKLREQRRAAWGASTQKQHQLYADRKAGLANAAANASDHMTTELLREVAEAGTHMRKGLRNTFGVTREMIDADQHTLAGDLKGIAVVDREKVTYTMTSRPWAMGRKAPGLAEEQLKLTTTTSTKRPEVACDEACVLRKEETAKKEERRKATMRRKEEERRKKLEEIQEQAAKEEAFKRQPIALPAKKKKQADWPLSDGVKENAGVHKPTDAATSNIKGGDLAEAAKKDDDAAAVKDDKEYKNDNKRKVAVLKTVESGPGGYARELTRPKIEPKDGAAAGAGLKGAAGEAKGAAGAGGAGEAKGAAGGVKFRQVGRAAVPLNLNDISQATAAVERDISL